MLKVAIIGGGPAGVMAAITAMQNSKKLEVVVFEKGEILKSLLHTGGGRCNLSYAEYDFRKLVKFFPRGEKFLLSIFSKFGVFDVEKFFLNLGVKTYIQEDKRIFPVSNRATEVKDKLLEKAEDLGVKFRNVEIKEVKKVGDNFFVNGNEFDKLVIATGGNRLKSKFSGYDFAESLGHSITKLIPVLCGLEIKESWCKKLSGLTLKNIKAKVLFEDKLVKNLEDDLLFTHQGISGPLSYKASSYSAYCDFNRENPLVLEINFVNNLYEIFDKELAQIINLNQKKNLITILLELLPRSLIEILMKEINLASDIKAGALIKNQRQQLSKLLTQNKVHVIAKSSGGEIVTAGGVDLKEVDARTMESKLIKNLYFCGEILDIDGLTGGFNLQACWSGGQVVGKNLLN